MGEARGSLVDPRGRFHAGVDVHAPEGTIVRAVANGKVSNPIAAAGFGSLTESVAIGPFTYVHLRVGRTRHDDAIGFDGVAVSADAAPLPGTVAGSHGWPFHLDRDETGVPVGVRLRRGTRVSIGDAIGTVNRFAHVHLNAGPTGHEFNPLLLPFAGFVDTVPPTIEPRGIMMLDAEGVPFAQHQGKRLIVRGRVHVIVDAYDRVDGNTRRRRLGVYRLGYQVLGADDHPVGGFENPATTLEFDRLPQDARAPRLVFAEGSGITVYGTRRTRFLYIVTNRLKHGQAEEDAWDTSALTPGPYTFRVIAADIAGNETKRDVPVLVQR
jgi:hypothetical protein